MVAVEWVDFSTREDTRTKVLQCLNTIIKLQSVLQTLFLSTLMPGVLILCGESSSGNGFLGFLGSGPPFGTFDPSVTSKLTFHC